MAARAKPKAAAVDERKSHGFGAGRGTPEPMVQSHAHGDLEINFLYSGRIRYFLGGRFVELPAEHMAVFWAAMPHQVIEVDPGTEFMWVNIPLITLLRWNLGNSFLRKILGGEVVIDLHGPAWDAGVTRRWMADLAAREPTLARTVELEVEARLRRLAFRKTQHTAPRSLEHRSRSQVEAITSFLARHYRDELSIADVAKAVGLHPNYAMTVFRRECGMPIWQYLTRLRLSHAQLMLLSTDMTVLAIALESGFGSLARFYAAFTRECGMAPGDYRKASQ